MVILLPIFFTFSFEIFEKDSIDFNFQLKSSEQTFEISKVCSIFNM